MENILVTGCAGFIGSHMVDLFLEKGHAVVGVDSYTYAAGHHNIRWACENKNFELYKEDICSTQVIADICEKHKIDWIINFAAESHVDKSIADVTPFIRSNIEGVASLLNVCRQTGAKMLQISTDEVYGSAKSGSFSETATLDPKNPYSASKAAAEHLVTSYHNTYGTPYKMVRMSNNFGPRQHYEKLIPTVVNCLKVGKKVPIYGDGTNVRDWLYVKDSVKLIYTVWESGAFNTTYNLTYCNETDNLTLVSQICEIMGVDPDVALTFVKDRPGHDFRYSISNQKLLELDPPPPTDFAKALDVTVTYLWLPVDN